VVPNGEYGWVPVASVVAITLEMFEAAKLKNWPSANGGTLRLETLGNINTYLEDQGRKLAKHGC